VSESDVIERYLAVLSANLPGGIVAEIADGLEEARGHYASLGMDPDAVARSTVAEFGPPEQIVSGFVAANPARRAARLLLAVGPAVGLCWGFALVAGRAWTWPIPAAARYLAGAALVAVIGLLVTAATSRRYRAAARAGTAGCAGTAVLDAAMLTAALAASPVLTWPLALACTFSAARVLLTLTVLRPVLVS
jgi:hypothetical protein